MLTMIQHGNKSIVRNKERALKLRSDVHDRLLFTGEFTVEKTPVNVRGFILLHIGGNYSELIMYVS